MEESQRKMLVAKAKAILSSKKMTIEILRNQRMMNLKLIQKSARSKKDPSPLASAMSTMGLKYPITADLQKAIAVEMPTELMAPRNIREDTHTHGRILCKKEAIDWWVDSSPLPKQPIIDAVNILFKIPREEVKRFYSIDWLNSKIKFGPPVIERRCVRTRTPSFEIPRQLQNALIKEALFPHLTLPDRRLTPYQKENIKELVNLSLQGKMSLMSQIRTLMTSLDPRVKCLPTIPGSSETTAALKHAISHSNLVVTEMNIVDLSDIKKDTLKLLLLVIRSTIYETRKHRWDKEEALKILNCFTIQNAKVEEILEQLVGEHCAEVKLARALYGMQNTMETERDGFISCPRLGSVTQVWARTAGGLRFLHSSGEEIVNFKYGSIKGNFSHSDAILISATMNYTCKRDVITTLSEIAITIKWGFKDSRGKDREKIHEEIRREITRAPWKVITCSREDFESVPWGKVGKLSIGCLTFNENSEYSSTGLLNLTITPTHNLWLEGTRQVVEIDIPKSSLRCYTGEIECTTSKMLHYFTFKKMVKNRYSFYLGYWKTVREKVELGDFGWENSCVNPYLEPKARAFSNACRRILISMLNERDWKKVYCSFLYIFCNKNPLLVDNPLMKITTREGYTIDLKAQEGIFKYDQNTESYRLFTIKAGDKEDLYDVGHMLDGCLTGFRITAGVNKDIPVKSIKELEETIDEIRDGEKFRIFINGEPFTAVRDSSMTFIHRDTNARQLCERMWNKEQVASVQLTEKRPWLAGHSGIEEVPESKRKKWGSNSSIDDEINVIVSGLVGNDEPDEWELDQW